MTTRCILRRDLPLALLLLLVSTAAAAKPPPVLREGEVSVGGGVRLHTLEGGSRTANTTLLFVPGWSTSSAIWQEQLAAFAPSARVVAVDPRSQGRSTVTTHSNTPEQRAQDLREVIRALGLKRVVLIGWSQGVQDVAAYAAAFSGENVAGYVLVDSTVGAGAADSVAHPERLRQELERLVLYLQHQEEYLEGMMHAIIRSPQGRKRVPELVRIGLRTPPDVGASMLLTDFIAVDRRPALERFDRPTLIIAAESDELEALREMSRQIAGSRLEVVGDAGHAVFLDQPERFHALLAAFVKELERKS